MVNGFYTDESGNNGWDSGQPILCYAGILVPHTKQVELQTKFQDISNNVLGRIKGTLKGIPNSEINTIPFFKDFELHASALFRGETWYSKIKDPHAIVDQVFALLKQNDIQMYSAVVNKQQYKSDTKADKPYRMYELAYTELVNLLNTDLTATDQWSFIIADNGKPEEQQVFSKVLQQQANDFRIYPDLQIKDSHTSNLIQIADIIAFISSVFFRQKYGFPNAKWHTPIVDSYNKNIAQNVKLWEYK